MDSLPAELRENCFELLSLQDRIALCAVSKAWRTFSLHSKRLWADIDVSIAFTRDLASVRTCFSLSGTHRLALRIRVMNANLEQDLLALVYTESHRIQSFQINNVFAPVEIRHLEGLPSILRALDVNRFSISDISSPLTTVTTFRGSFTTDILLSSNFFRIFPNLASLECYGPKPPLDIPLKSLPPSLLRLTFPLGSQHLLVYLPDLFTDSRRPIQTHERLSIRYSSFELSGTTRHVPGMRTICINTYSGGIGVLGDHAVVALLWSAFPTLKYLLVAGEDTVAQLLCSGWVLPRLEELVLEDPGFSEGDSSGTLEVPALRTLRLRVRPLNVPLLIGFLQALPRIWTTFIAPHGLRVEKISIESMTTHSTFIHRSRYNRHMLKGIDFSEITNCVLWEGQAQMVQYSIAM